jgi:hypothetical protein
MYLPTLFFTLSRYSCSVRVSCECDDVHKADCVPAEFGCRKACQAFTVIERTYPYAIAGDRSPGWIGFRRSYSASCPPVCATGGSILTLLQIVTPSGLPG